MKKQKQADTAKAGKSGNPKRALLLAVLAIAMPLMLAGCMPGDGASTATHQAGFFSGVWHGWIAPISLIVSIFDKDISIYEVNNTGWFYDFGYYIAVISGFGGLALSRKRRTKTNNSRPFDE